MSGLKERAANCKPSEALVIAKFQIEVRQVFLTTGRCVRPLFNSAITDF
jgi:hypothetical protein